MASHSSLDEAPHTSHSAHEVRPGTILTGRVQDFAMLNINSVQGHTGACFDIDEDTVRQVLREEGE